MNCFTMLPLDHIVTLLGCIGFSTTTIWKKVIVWNRNVLQIQITYHWHDQIIFNITKLSAFWESFIDIYLMCLTVSRNQFIYLFLYIKRKVIPKECYNIRWRNQKNRRRNQRAAQKQSFVCTEIWRYKSHGLLK